MASPSSYCRPAKRCRLPNPGPAWPTPVPGRARRLWRGCPITRSEAQAMIAEVKGARLLRGFRGRPAADLDALADTLVRVSDFAMQMEGQLAELDINPLMVLPAGQGVKAVDALVVLHGA